MNPLAPYRWVLYLVLAAAAVTAGYALVRRLEEVGYDRAAGIYQKAIDKQKAEAAASLAAEAEKVTKSEAALAEAKNTQELRDVDHQKAVTDLAAQLRSSAGPSRRLRDPNAPGCRASGSGAAGQAAAPASAGPDDGAQAGGLLSAELTGLLQRLTREADDINNAYASCRPDSISVRVLQPH
jgi:hypothetical protein